MTAPTAPPISADLEVLRRIFDEGFATGNDAVVDELCSPDLVEHQFGLSGSGAPKLFVSVVFWSAMFASSVGW